jgi:hypothetical protein
MSPDGSGLSLIADTIPNIEATETSGILDISSLVGYKPGSILLTNNQGSTSSQTVLISPYAALAGDFNSDGVVDSADYAVWRKGWGTIYTQADYDVWRAQYGRTPGSGAGVGLDGASPVPEPSTLILIIAGSLALTARRSHKSSRAV